MQQTAVSFSSCQRNFVILLSEEPILDISVQEVKSLGGHFACFCQEFDFHEVKKYFIIIFQKGKYFYTF